MLETLASWVRVHTMTHCTFPINTIEVMFPIQQTGIDITAFVTDINTYIFNNDTISAVLYS